MPTFHQQLTGTISQTGEKLGAIAGALRHRMYAANAAGEYEKAKAADALYQDCIYLAMRIGRLQITTIDQSEEMLAALKAVKDVNKGLATEKSRVLDLNKKINSAAGTIENVGRAINKLTALVG